MEARVSEEQVMVSIFSLMVFAGVAVLWLAMSNRRALREMEHRERIALIQAGIVPAPEADPLAFETHFEPSSTLSRKDRWRTAGTLTIGFGAALLLLLSFTGVGEIGIAVGGAFIVLGASFLLNGMLLSPTPTAVRPMVRRTSTGTPAPPDPPSSTPF
jgi:hypothetical protein